MLPPFVSIQSINEMLHERHKQCSAIESLYVLRDDVKLELCIGFIFVAVKLL